MDSYIEIKDDIKYKLIYQPPFIKTPFSNKIKIIFADYIASGPSSPYIDKFVINKINPFYSNVHSNSYCGTKMDKMVNKTKNIIRKMYNLKPSQKIIFTGQGATGAINHLSNLINYTLFDNINIILSIYEHHSNYLPWLKISTLYPNVKIHYNPLTENGNIDLIWLDDKLKQLVNLNNTLNIITLTGCSNVSGIITPINKLRNIINKYNNDFNKNNSFKKFYLFIDYACMAPYKRIDASLVDAMFYSPHKFIGGSGTPGLLIVEEELFTNYFPYAPGGGSVEGTTKNKIIFEKDLEKKETGGTPNIVGIIKFGKILKLHYKFYDVIENNEIIIMNYIYDKLNIMLNKYNILKIIFLNNENRLPIISIFIDGLHFDLLVLLFNDLFGIQTKGGISCCGLLAQFIYEKYNTNGWCRISFSWLMSKLEIDFILNSIEHILLNIDLYKKQYIFDDKKNMWLYNKNYKLN